MKKRLVPLVLLAAALSGASAGGWYWWTTGRFRQTTDNAYVHADIVRIAPKVAGYVKEVAVGDNQSVAAGDLLVRLDDRDYRARLAEAEAAVAAQGAAIANIDSRLDLQQSLIAQASADIGAAEAEALRSSRDLARTRDLVKDDFVSRQRYDGSVADTGKANAALQRTRAALEAARRQLAVIETEKAQARALLHQAEAALDLARSALEDTEIRAPATGVVGNRGVRVGEYVQPGSLLMALVQLPQVWVEANFKETQVGALTAGQAAEIVVDALPGQILQGRIDSLAPASGAQFSLLPPENASGNFTKIVQRIPVRIALDPDDGAVRNLRPGMSVVVRVDTSLKGPPLLAYLGRQGS